MSDRNEFAPCESDTAACRGVCRGLGDVDNNERTREVATSDYIRSWDAYLQIYGRHACYLPSAVYPIICFHGTRQSVLCKYTYGGGIAAPAKGTEPQSEIEKAKTRPAGCGMDGERVKPPARPHDTTKPLLSYRRIESLVENQRGEPSGRSRKPDKSSWTFRCASSTNFRAHPVEGPNNVIAI